mgnify:CR=1 FL=1
MKLIVRTDLEKDTLDEINLMQLLHHANIIRLYESFLLKDNRVFYMILEYCPVSNIHTFFKDFNL